MLMAAPLPALLVALSYSVELLSGSESPLAWAAGVPLQLTATGWLDLDMEERSLDMVLLSIMSVVGPGSIWSIVLNLLLDQETCVALDVMAGTETGVTVTGVEVEIVDCTGVTTVGVKMSVRSGSVAGDENDGGGCGFGFGFDLGSGTGAEAWTGVGAWVGGARGGVVA
jgi:hypothetical protein